MMRALTVQQPWAWAIIHGGKLVENRTTLWRYRGPLAIHAGTRWSHRGARSGLVWSALKDRYGWPTGPMAARADHRPGFTAIRPLGAIIGTVNLADVHPASPGCCESEWAEQSYLDAAGRTRTAVVHLVLEEPRAIEPVYVVGRLGLWRPANDVQAEVRRRLVAA